MTMRHPIRILLSLCVVLSITGCGRLRSNQPEIALIMKSLANEFFQTMANGAESHHAANPDAYTLIVNGIKNETDLGQQVNLVEQMVARGVDVIVIAPADSKALVPALKRAADAGILVINIDNKLDEEVMQRAGLKCPFVGPDNYEGALNVGIVLGTQLKRGDKVAIIEGIPTAFNGQQRRKGFEKAMEQVGAEVVSIQSGRWEMAQANTVASSLLTAHPDLKAILCANDSMALGAVAAIEAAGRKEVAVVGFDNISAIQPMLADGRVLATADQHADKLAVYGIEAALDMIKNKTERVDRTTRVDIIVGNP